MGKHISEELFSERWIFGSDDDQPLIMECFVGFNSNHELVVGVDFLDYDEPEFNCSTAAIVNKEDCEEMARRHRVRYSELPDFIWENMEEWRELRCPTLNDVKESFKEITDSLIEERCRLKMVRTSGAYGYICC